MQNLLPQPNCNDITLLVGDHRTMVHAECVPTLYTQPMVLHSIQNTCSLNENTARHANIIVQGLIWSTTNDVTSLQSSQSQTPPHPLPLPPSPTPIPYPHPLPHPLPPSPSPHSTMSSHQICTCSECNKINSSNFTYYKSTLLNGVFVTS